MKRWKNKKIHSISYGENEVQKACKLISASNKPDVNHLVSFKQIHKRISRIGLTYCLDVDTCAIKTARRPTERTPPPFAKHHPAPVTTHPRTHKLRNVNQECFRTKRSERRNPRPPVTPHREHQQLTFDPWRLTQVAVLSQSELMFSGLSSSLTRVVWEERAL